MLRHNRRERRQPMAEINVVPYIDVMLVLLVIFMITAPLLSQGVHVNLPNAQAKALSVTQGEPIIVTVNAQGKYFLNVAADPAMPMKAQNLINRVAAELQIAKKDNQKRQVLVKGDQDAEYGKVVQVMVLLQHAGVATVGLMTSTPQRGQTLTRNSKH